MTHGPTALSYVRLQFGAEDTRLDAHRARDLVEANHFVEVRQVKCDATVGCDRPSQHAGPATLGRNRQSMRARDAKGCAHLIGARRVNHRSGPVWYVSARDDTN